MRHNFSDIFSIPHNRWVKTVNLTVKCLEILKKNQWEAKNKFLLMLLWSSKPCCSIQERLSFKSGIYGPELTRFKPYRTGPDRTRTIDRDKLKKDRGGNSYKNEMKLPNDPGNYQNINHSISGR